MALRAPRESSIQKKIKTFLELRGFKVYKINDRFRSGIPDLYAIRAGKSIWIEVKRPGEQPTKLQQYEIDQLRDAGAAVTVARSVEDVQPWLPSTGGQVMDLPTASDKPRFWRNCCADCSKQVDSCTKPEYRCSAYGCDKSWPCRPCPDFQPKDGTQ